MTIRKNDAWVNREFDCMFNAGAALHALDNGTSLWQTGAQNSNANAALAGTTVSTITHAADASAAATARGVVLQGTMEDTAADNDGIIGHVRFQDPTATYWWEGSAGEQGPTVNITAAALVGGIVQFTANAHGLANLDQVEIAGHSVTGLNGKWDVINVAANTFQIMSPLAPGAGGTARKTFDVVIDNADLNAGQDFKVLSMALFQPM